MARRRTATLILAALVLALAGCGAAHAAGTGPAWKAAPVAQPDTVDSEQPDPAPTSAAPTTPPPAGPKAGAKPGAPAGPKAPPKPTPSRTTPSGGPGPGPAGALTTTGTAAVALTFDDGPYGQTGQVLDLLAEHHIKATFCVIGRQVADGAELIKRIVAEGHSLCNHTWSHDLNLRNRPADQIIAEMQKTNDAIHAIVPNAPIKYFRNPGGLWSAQTVSIAASLGMKSIHWAVDPWDWKQPPPQMIINNVLGHTRAGSIVLLHDGGGDRTNTVIALRTILPSLASRFTLIALPTS